MWLDASLIRGDFYVLNKAIHLNPGFGEALPMDGKIGNDGVYCDG